MSAQTLVKQLKYVLPKSRIAGAWKGLGASMKLLPPAKTLSPISKLTMKPAIKLPALKRGVFNGKPNIKI